MGKYNILHVNMGKLYIFYRNNLLHKVIYIYNTILCFNNLIDTVKIIEIE